MNEIEFFAIAKIISLIIAGLIAVLSFSKDVRAQANILASTPNGTRFCNTADAQSSVDMSSCTDGMAIPVGTTGQRSGTPISGTVRYNSTNSNIEAYSGGSWWALVPQIQSNWTESVTTALDYIQNKPSFALPVSYENTTQHLSPILINKTATVAGGAGNAAFNLTSDGTSTGTALCPNGVMLNSPNIAVNDATAPYQFSWAWSNSNKTMTVLAQKASGLAVLTFTLLGLPAPVPNGTNVNATVICY